MPGHPVGAHVLRRPIFAGRFPSSFDNTFPQPAIAVHAATVHTTAAAVHTTAAAAHNAAVHAIADTDAVPLHPPNDHAHTGTYPIPLYPTDDSTVGAVSLHPADDDADAVCVSLHPACYTFHSGHGSPTHGDSADSFAKAIGLTRDARRTTCGASLWSVHDGRMLYSCNRQSTGTMYSRGHGCGATRLPYAITDRTVHEQRPRQCRFH